MQRTILALAGIATVLGVLASTASALGPGDPIGGVNVGPPECDVDVGHGGSCTLAGNVGEVGGDAACVDGGAETPSLPLDGAPQGSASFEACGDASGPTPSAKYVGKVTLIR